MGPHDLVASYDLMGSPGASALGQVVGRAKGGHQSATTACNAGQPLPVARLHTLTDTQPHSGADAGVILLLPASGPSVMLGSAAPHLNTYNCLRAQY